MMDKSRPIYDEDKPYISKSHICKCVFIAALAYECALRTRITHFDIDTMIDDLIMNPCERIKLNALSYSAPKKFPMIITNDSGTMWIDHNYIAYEKDGEGLNYIYTSESYINEEANTYRVAARRSRPCDPYAAKSLRDVYNERLFTRDFLSATPVYIRNDYEDFLMPFYADAKVEEYRKHDATIEGIKLLKKPLNDLGDKSVHKEGDWSGDDISSEAKKYIRNEFIYSEDENDECNRH